LNKPLAANGKGLARKRIRTAACRSVIMRIQ